VQRSFSDCHRAGQSLARRHAEDDIAKITAERDEAKAQWTNWQAQSINMGDQIRHLQRIAKWLVAEEREHTVTARKRHRALEKAVQALPYKEISQNYRTDPPVATIVLKKSYAAESVVDDRMPTPDRTNVAHVRFADTVLELLFEGWGPDGGLPQATARVLRAMRAEADRLERERSESAERERLVQKVGQSLTDSGIYGSCSDEEFYAAVRTALDSAGMLAGGDA
jgi:hypothetical protein